MKPKPDESPDHYMKRVIKVALEYMLEGGISWDRTDGLDRDTPVHLPAHDYENLQSAFEVLQDAEEHVAGEEEVHDYLPESQEYLTEAYADTMGQSSSVTKYNDEPFIQKTENCINELKQWTVENIPEKIELPGDLHSFVEISWINFQNQITFHSDKLNLSERDVEEMDEKIGEILSDWSKEVAENIDEQAEPAEALSWTNTYYISQLEETLRQEHDSYRF